MFAPGTTFSAAGRVNATVGAATAADFVNEGVGFMNNGNVAMDSDPPSGNSYKEGTRLNATGAVFVTVSTDPSDIWLSGLRHSTSGQLVIESADPTFWNNGDPLTAAGVLSVS